MMSLQAFQGLLSGFGSKIGLPELAADDAGYCCLSFDEQIVHLQYEPDEDELAVFAQLGRVDESDKGPFYERLLAANLFWGGTDGATLAVQPEDAMVYLATRAALAALDQPRFEALLERFIATADRWRAEVEAYVSPEPVRAEAVGDGGEPRAAGHQPFIRA